MHTALVLLVAASALRTEVADALENLKSTGDISRVTDSLKALVQSVADETKARLVVTHGAASWCEDTLAAKKKAVEDASEAGTEATAELQDAEAKGSAAKEKVEEIKRSIGSAEGELSELEKDFDGKKAAYKDALKKLTEAQEGVSQSLLHKGKTVRTQSADLQKLRALDSELVKAPSFLQLNKDDSATASAEDDMEKEKTLLDEDWTAQQREAAGLMKEKKQEIADLESDLETAQLSVGMAMTAGAALTREKASAERTADREAKLRTGIDAACEANSKYYAAQEELRSEQTAKLRESLDLLRALTRASLVQFAAPSFLQLSNKPTSAQELLEIFEGEVNAAPTAAPVQDAALAQVTLDPLADIKAKIQGMLDALRAQENAEKGPDDFCSTELASNRDKKGKKQDDADRFTAEMRAAQLKTQEFGNTVSGATLGRNALAAEKARVDQEFGTEQGRVAEEKKDHDLAIEVLDKAVSLVNDEFGAALLQGGAMTNRAVDASKVTAALNAARDLFAQQTGAAESFLTAMETRTETQVTELDAAVRARDQEISEAESGQADQQDQAAQAKESRQTAQSELTSILTYLENLGQQCGPSLGNSYEELKRQREEEVQGLQEALKVLEGEAIPTMSLAVKNILVKSAAPLDAAQRAAQTIGV
jgi:chromosome segregation ATPase